MKRIQTNKGFIFFIPAVIIAVSALFGGVVALAQVSLPGGALYGIKTATEHVRLAAAFTDKSKAKTHLSIAKDKLTELETLSEKNASTEVLEKTEKAFNDNQAKSEGYILKQEKGSSMAVKLNKILDDNRARNKAVLSVIAKKKN